MFSLIVTGTPSSGESGVRARQRDSAARACSSAASASTRYIALTFGSHTAMRASEARATSTGESSPRAYAAPSSRAPSSWMAAMAGGLYTRRAVLRSLKFVAIFFAVGITAGVTAAAAAHARDNVLVWHAL